MNEPHAPAVVVCAGGGGVGKTTMSAALALALARAGRRAMVVTVDPARRLADAMGVSVGSEAQPARLDGAEDRLLALMPEPRRATRWFVEYLLAGRPEALRRLLDIRLYRVLEEAVPGVPELVALNLIARTLERHALDAVVIDTAPSRQAVDFVTYPQRLAALLNGRAVGWLARLSQRDTERTGGKASAGRRVASSAAARAERLLAAVLGSALDDVRGIFAAMSLELGRFAGVARQGSELLLGPRTRHVLVAAPTGASEEDARYIATRFAKLGIEPAVLVVNGAGTTRPAWLDRLDAAEQASEAVREALRVLGEEQRCRADATEVLARGLRHAHPRIPQLHLPFVEAAEPKAIVEALAAELEGHLRLFV
ncbi:MAG: AAA family ATPase [Deltaproteobacteria bacterium]|nr:AAA family ATPase [Deltaproteobacteria bacterium]